MEERGEQLQVRPQRNVAVMVSPAMLVSDGWRCVPVFTADALVSGDSRCRVSSMESWGTSERNVDAALAAAPHRSSLSTLQPDRNER